jgi:hypothetical protein
MPSPDIQFLKAQVRELTRQIDGLMRRDRPRPARDPVPLDPGVAFRVVSYNAQTSEDWQLTANCVPTNGQGVGVDVTVIVITHPVPVGKTIFAIPLAEPHLESTDTAYPALQQRWVQIPAPVMPRVGKIVCKGPAGEADFTDHWHWVQIQSATATCDATGKWTVSDAGVAKDFCLDPVATAPQIIAAPNIGNAVAGKHEQPGKLCVLIPIVTTGSNVPVRYAITYVDPSNNNQQCGDTKKCRTKWTYKWACSDEFGAGDPEEHEGVTEVERVCTNQIPILLDQWVLNDQDSDHIKVFEYFSVGDACEDDADCGTLTAPDPPSAELLAKACNRSPKNCANPVVKITVDDTFIYVEYCDGTTDKFARCCDGDPVDGEEYCADLYECEWDCVANAPVPLSMRFVGSECGAWNAKTETWFKHSRTGDIAKLRRWVNTHRICVDGVCSAPPITGTPDYPTEAQAAVANACFDVDGSNCDAECDCDGAGTEYTIPTTGVKEDDFVSIPIEAGKRYCFEYLSGASMAGGSGEWYGLIGVRDVLPDDGNGGEGPVIFDLGDQSTFHASAAAAEASAQGKPATNRTQCYDNTLGGATTLYALTLSGAFSGTTKEYGGTTPKIRVCEIPA